MGKLLSKTVGATKSVGKSYYFYYALYWVGLISTTIITFVRYDIIAQALNFSTIWEALILLCAVWSIPVLAYTFLQKLTRRLAMTVAGIMFIVVLIIYWVSTAGAEVFVADTKEFLYAFLFIFVLINAFSIGIKGSKKIR